MFKVFDMRDLRTVCAEAGDDARVMAGSLLELKWWRDPSELFARPEVKAMLHGSRRHGWFRAGDLRDWIDGKRGAE